MEYQIVIRKTDKSLFIISFQDLDLAKKIFKLMLPGFKTDGEIELHVVNIIGSSGIDR